jgi:hypothetical protein
MVNAAIAAIVMCLEFAQPTGFTDECQAMFQRAVPSMENFDSLPAEKQKSEEVRASKIAQLFVHEVCEQNKEPEECTKAGLKLAKLVWDSIVREALALHKSHTA